MFFVWLGGWVCVDWGCLLGCLGVGCGFVVGVVVVCCVLVGCVGGGFVCGWVVFCGLLWVGWVC